MCYDIQPPRTLISRAPSDVSRKEKISALLRAYNNVLLRLDSSYLAFVRRLLAAEDGLALCARWRMGTPVNSLDVARGRDLLVLSQHARSIASATRRSTAAWSCPSRRSRTLHARSFVVCLAYQHFTSVAILVPCAEVR